MKEEGSTTSKRAGSAAAAAAAAASPSSYGYDSYLSPFTWRYGSKEMRRLFSERRRRATWRKVWLSLATAEADLGLMSSRELEGIKRSAGEESVDILKAHEIERRSSTT